MPDNNAPPAPQTTPKQPEPIHMKCRNPSGRCDSMTAVATVIPGTSNRMYRCTKCSHTWGINVGGNVNL